MRKVNKNLNSIPGSLISQQCRDHYSIITNILCSDFRKASDNFYRGSDVVKKLRAIYNDKCAYCESFEDHPEVEHYRPKKRVSDTPHLGYYWLAYEWSNLLPACHDCNKTGVKGNHFPVLNYHQESPAYVAGVIDLNQNKLESAYLLHTEIPLLLNPEISNFDPFKYFYFDEVGFMKPVSPKSSINYLQASSTIKIVQLNRSKLFLIIRKKEIRDFHKAVKLLLYQFLKNEVTEVGLRRQISFMLKQLKGKSNPKKPYSFFYEYMYKKINVYINKAIKPKYRPLFYEIVQDFKAQHDI